MMHLVKWQHAAGFAIRLSEKAVSPKLGILGNCYRRY